MEVKKNPEVNVSRNSSLYFAIGLNLMLLSTYLILEYKSYKKEDVIVEALDLDDYIDEDIEIINLSAPPPPPTLAVVPEDIKVIEDIVDIQETIIESSEMNQTDIIAEIVRVEDVEVEEVEEDIEVPFSVIENIPVFPGCENRAKAEQRKCFENAIKAHVRKNFKYPDAALELGIYGKVYVLFIIDNTGYVAKVKSRGPDKILEKEAERIISSLPKMIPGKQRGIAVSVPYSIPISFVLNE
ncbi:energy transducer TonB [Psychroserpens burtonensis]|uniref:energy transducer TonB n=1 Tax=Psychroserpens burtonensis TaxID=49278 RepID=UPI0004208F89|nr:energy transducer TonB [Psychroserpens burtonensis]